MEFDDGGPGKGCIATSACDTNIKNNEKKVKIARGHRHRKKIYRVDFFAKAFSSGLTNYVIRHNS